MNNGLTSVFPPLFGKLPSYIWVMMMFKAGQIKTDYMKQKPMWSLFLVSSYFIFLYYDLYWLFFFFRSCASLLKLKVNYLEPCGVKWMIWPIDYYFFLLFDLIWCWFNLGIFLKLWFIFHWQESNPYACLVFYWEPLNRQVKVTLN